MSKVNNAVPSILSSGSGVTMKGGGSIVLPRVAQHETLHTINVALQQAALSSVRGAIWSDRAAANARSSTMRSCRYLQSLARKATLRLDSSIKRSICRGCRSMMLPGISASTRVRPSRSCDLVVVMRCFSCNMRHRLPCPALHGRRFKAPARHRKKRALIREMHQLARKVVNLHNICDKDETQTYVVVEATFDRPTQTSQRSRRRAGREKALQMRGRDFHTSSATRRSRRRKHRNPNSTADTDHDDDHEPGYGAVDHAADKISDEVTPKRRRARKATRLDLQIYSDRVTGQATSWKRDLPHELGEKQREALGLLRGDHVLSIGLGKGGMIGCLHDL